MTKINFKKSTGEMKRKMTMQKTNPKLIAASLFIVLVVMTGIDPSFASPTNSDCSATIRNQMISMGSSLDQSKAISLASNSQAVQSKINGYTTSSSASNTWSWDTTTCSNLTLEAVNVSYSLHDAKGYVKNVDVLLDPTLTKVISVNEHILPQYATTLPVLYNGTHWSGYEFAANSTGDKPIWQAQATYTLPTVSKVTGKCTSTLPCDLAIWPGLENNLGASSGLLAQAGTDEQWTNCNTTCSYSAWIWYEFYPNAYTCGGITLSNGDSMSVTVTNEQANGGSNNKYDVSMQDTTTGHGCSLTGQTYSLTRPYFADFIDERAGTSGGSLETLASFTSNSISGTYNDGSSWAISRPYSNDWFERDLMKNSGTLNISLGGVSLGSFTETYQSSSGT